MKSFLAGLLTIVSLAFSNTRAETAPSAIPVTIALVGDSTVSSYEPAATRRGWGQMLPEFLAPGTIVLNEAKAGASSKTFPAERWQKVLSAHPDFVLLQFGHNDSHAKTIPHATDAATDFRDHLRRFIAEARAAGIVPILVTPVHRRLFEGGRPTRELVPYADAMKAVAAETGAALLDLHGLSGALFTTLGEAGTEGFTPPRPTDPTRKEDRTHFTATGAREIARLVARALPPLDPRLAAATLPSVSVQ